jgi:hypothetical protein
MKYSTRVVLQMTDDPSVYLLLEKDSHEFDGAPELACGPSGQEETAQAEQESLANQEASDFASRFGTQSGYMSTISKALEPIVSGGPNQEGFSAAEKANLETTNLNANAAANRNAAQSVGNALAGRGGGGTSGLTSGVDQQIKASIASQSANATAAGQNQIEAADYATGRQQFDAATQGLESLAGLANPGEFGSQATSGFGQSFQEADKIQQEKNAMQADIAGMVTGAVGDFTTGTEGGGGLGGGLLALAGG